VSAPWPEVQLTQVADLVRGVSYPKTDSRDDAAPGYVPVLRATNIQEARLVLESDLVYVAESNVSVEQRLRPGDIVVATSSGSKHLVGKSALLHSQWNGSFGAFCAGIRPKPNIESRYLAYFLQSPRYWREIGKKALGVNINNLRRGDLETLSLPLPPAESQSEIVAEIEKQFSRLDEAVANLQRVKANLRRTTASTYQSAIDGTLTEPVAARSSTSAANAMDGKDLLARIQEMHRATWSGRGKYQAPSTPSFQGLPELPQDWLWTTWGQIGHAQNGRPFPSKEYTDSGIKLLRPGNMHQSGGLVWSESNTRLVPERYEPENADLRIGGGELVMNLTAQSLKDEFLGRVCLTSEGERCLLNQRLARLTPCGFPTAFALIVFKSRWFRTFVDRLNTGSLTGC
jgi:type I restriction enzyme, S subunit